MKTINVSEATDLQLDWLVANCWYDDRRVELGVLGHLAFGVERQPGSGDRYTGWMPFTPTTDPAQMWPIIEREKIVICDWDYNSEIYAAELLKPYSKYTQGQGPTQLVAMARCYVISKLGETVEVPEEL